MGKPQSYLPNPAPLLRASLEAAGVVMDGWEESEAMKSRADSRFLVARLLYGS
jgi:hypothetical protein